MNRQQTQPPDDLETLRSVINARQAVFPKRLAQVARHILDDPDEVALGSVASIAAAAQVTPSTLIRFAQYLGYDGFSALQGVFRRAVRQKISSGEKVARRQRKQEAASYEVQVFDETINGCHQALHTLSRTIPMADIKIAASILSSANCVFILAGKGTFPLAVLLQQCLTQLNIRSNLLTDVAGGDDVIGFATPGDAAVIFNCAPYAKYMTAHASNLSTRGVPVIALTDSNFSPLSGLASVKFKVIESGQNGLSPLTAGIALSQVLALCTRQSRQNAHTM